MALLGLSIACEDNNGGGAKLYLTEAANVSSMTKGTGVESYSTITMVTGAVFTEYEFEEDILGWKPTDEATKGAYKCTDTIEVDFGKLTQLQRDAIQELLDSNACGFVGIVELNNGDKWVIGYDEKDGTDRPLRITATAGDSKTDLMEPTNNVVTLVRVGRERSRTFTGTVPTS